MESCGGLATRRERRFPTGAQLDKLPHNRALPGGRRLGNLPNSRKQRTPFTPKSDLFSLQFLSLGRAAA
jgi:hypothetical protein